MANKKHSKESIKENLLKLNNDRIYNFNDYTNLYLKNLIPHYNTILEYYDSIENAFESAGLKYKKNKIYTKEIIIDILKRELLKTENVTQKNLWDLYYKGILCHPTVVYSKVGTIKYVCKILNLKFDKDEKKLSREKVIEILKYSYNKYGKLSSFELMKQSKVDKKLCTPNSIRKYLGCNIQEAYKIIGIE